MSKSPFEKVSPQVQFAAEEHAILKLWEELDAFHESNRRRAGNEPFIFYDGPPFATGTPHYGHLLAGTIKDIVPRYWNMRGHPVERRFGWDCHGLPIEALAQDALGLKGTAQILEKGVDTFNETCRSMVQTYVSEWRQTVTRMGRWVDFDRDYKTMDPEFMETVWWVFKQLYEQGRVYKSYRIMPYSWRLTTPLSNFEANANYKDVQDPAITVRFRVKEAAESTPLAGALSNSSVYILAWTTTPWTLPSNLALCVGPEIEYVGVRVDGQPEIYVASEARLPALFKKSTIEKVFSCLGRDLAGAHYEPLFPYFKDQPGAFTVLSDDFVSTGDGTGIVHMAPAYGEDDFRVCRAAGIDLVDPLDAEARFTSQVPDYQGQFCKDADAAIMQDLKSDGRLVHRDTIVHSYPFDERTDTPLIYRAIEAFYVRVTDLRDDLVAQNDTVHWVPEAVGKNRFGNWLKDAADWNISRNRFWGSCIPIWINVDDPNDMICVGSVDELEALSGVRVKDLHKHIVDQVVIRKDGKTYKRTPEVLDCWFESGAMPYAQQHYPFRPKDPREGRAGDPSGPGSDERFRKFFPAHFIAEGLDQTRGWFYTLLVLGTALFGRTPFRNVIVNGLILAEDGQKMSKRKKNYPDPTETIEAFGADALRAYMVSSPVVRGEPLRFSERGLKEIVRTVVLPYFNVLSFFTTYAVIDGYDPRDPEWTAPEPPERPALDRWILSALSTLVRDVNQEMEAYRLFAVVPRLTRFIDELTNWYVRRARPRFWAGQRSNQSPEALRFDKASAYGTLYDVLVTFSRVLAPFMPFLTELVHQKLVVTVDPRAPKSVHFCDYPLARLQLIDLELETTTALAQDLVSLGRKVREDHKLKVRQPLAKLTVVHRDPVVRASAESLADLIKDELNVKEVVTAADESAFTTVTVKPNFKTLGKRCGKKLGAIGAALAGLSTEAVRDLEDGKSLEIEGEMLTLEDVILQRSSRGDAAVATDGNVTVALDTTLTPELIAEGHAREFISQLQNARKSAGLEVTDRVSVRFACSEPLVEAALRNHAAWVALEILATTVEPSPGLQGQELDLNGTKVQIELEKAKA